MNIGACPSAFPRASRTARQRGSLCVRRSSVSHAPGTADVAEQRDRALAAAQDGAVNVPALRRFRTWVVIALRKCTYAAAVEMVALQADEIRCRSQLRVKAVYKLQAQCNPFPNGPKETYARRSWRLVPPPRLPPWNQADQVYDSRSLPGAGTNRQIA